MDSLPQWQELSKASGLPIFIPAGVPHQMTAVNGEVQFLLFRWDTK